MKLIQWILLVGVLLYSAFRLIQQGGLLLGYPDNLGHPVGVFGYPISLGWLLLVFVYWLTWIAGVMFVLMRKPIGFLLVLPVALIGIFVTGVTIFLEISREIEAYDSMLQFVALVGFFTFINSASVTRYLGITKRSKYYMTAALIFVGLASLFLIVPKHI